MKLQENILMIITVFILYLDKSNKYTLYQVKMLYSIDEKEKTFVREYTNKNTHTAIFLLSNEDAINELSQYIQSFNSIMFYLSPSIGNCETENVICMSGKFYTYIRHSITHFLLISNKQFNKIVVIDDNTEYHEICYNYIQQTINLFSPFIKLIKYNVNDIISHYYNLLDINDKTLIILTITNGLDNLLDAFEYYTVNDNVPTLVLYYQSDIIKTNRNIMYSRSFNLNKSEEWIREFTHIFENTYSTKKEIILSSILDMIARYFYSVYLYLYIVIFTWLFY